MSQLVEQVREGGREFEKTKKERKGRDAINQTIPLSIRVPSRPETPPVLTRLQ